MEEASTRIEQGIELWELSLRAGLTVAQARSRLIALLGLAEAEVNRAQAGFEVKAGRIRRAEPPRVLEGKDAVEPWYTGPSADDEAWTALRAVLGERLGSQDAVDSLDRASTRVVSFLSPPGSSTIQTRGLVLGHVQSGKTTNFSAVIAKAADTGYRLFVVLSGIHNALRAQTQERLERDLHQPNPHRWHLLSSEISDFVNPGFLNATKLVADTETRLLAVVKKNRTRLSQFLEWLRSAGNVHLGSLPILVIDDEADQASIDTSRAGRDERSAINQVIVDLLTEFPKVAYVGYTATPFANFFIDPAHPLDLYPKDFIIDLDRPSGYFGPEEIFGRERIRTDGEDWDSEGLDLVRIVPIDDVRALRPPTRAVDRAAFSPSVPPSLKTALFYFVLACAARRSRAGGTASHSTMLIHTTLYTAFQAAMKEPIRRLVQEFTDRLEEGDLSELQALWEREASRVPAEVFDGVGPSVEFGQLVPQLAPVLQDLEIVVDNYQSEERLSYEGRPRTVVVIGGNTLSRGLTLEGLVVSYFIRTASAYDSLLQMGRWFGFRPGYADLARMWMTEELEGYFSDLATVEAEIRIDIRRLHIEGATPLELPVRVRTHPKLAITDRMKMQQAVPVEVSYSKRRLQTILFEHADGQWLLRNLEAARSLIAAAGEFKISPGGSLVASDVAAGTVLEFLASYAFHTDAVDLRSDLLNQYIIDQNSRGALLSWSVGVMSVAEGPYGTLDLGSPVGRVALMGRSRVNSSGHANIKTLMSRPDAVTDLHVDKAVRDASWEHQVGHRASTPLLLVYPISKDSRAKNRPGYRQRFDLDAKTDVIGVALCFPEVVGDATVTYVGLKPIAYDYVEDEEAVPEDPDL